MKAYVHQGSNLQFAHLTKPVLANGEVLIKMKSLGLNRRDLMIPTRRGENTEPLVIGSDGAGVVEDVADHVTRFKKGDQVIVNPGMGWITNDETAPNTLQIVGFPDHGTFAEYYVVDAEYIEPKPDHLNWEEAGVLALAALTAFRALFTKGQVKPNETVFIPGAGSGVATYLIQFAKVIGARVIVTSRSQEKLDQAIKLGADKAIGSNEDWDSLLENETIDLVIDSVGRATFARSLKVLRNGGRLVTFGATTEDEVAFDVRSFFYAQQQILGSTLGSREELREMLSFVSEHQLHPVIDKTFAFSNIEEAFSYLTKGDQFGKIAVKISD